MDNTKKKTNTNYLVIILVVVAALVAVYVFFIKDKDSVPVENLYSESYTIDDAFVTNVSNSQKLFKASVVLVVNQENMTAELDANLHIIRDTILFILRNLTEDDITKMGIQDELRVTITNALNEALDTQTIATVYFSDFVMQ